MGASLQGTEVFRRCKLFASLAISCAQLATGALATEPLEVALTRPSYFTERESGRILVTITNHSDQTLLLPRLKTPLFNTDDHLMGNDMDVRGEVGRVADFRGRRVNIPLSARRDFYAEILPGESLANEVNLARDDDLSAGGHFSVTYEQNYGDLYLYEAEGQPWIQSPSNELEVFVSPALIP